MIPTYGRLPVARFLLMPRVTLEVPPKYAAISASSSGDNTLVAAVSGKKIRVLACVLMSAGTVTATFKSANGGTSISGAYPFIAQAGLVMPFSEGGWMETVAGQLLNLSLNGAVAVTGNLVYQEIF